MLTSSQISTPEKKERTNVPLSPPKEAVHRRAPAFRRMMAAWPYDFLVCYWLSACLVGPLACLTGGASLPYTPFSLIMLLLFLIRDFSFSGLGNGKEMLGLKVVDRKSGMPPTRRQCLIRNFVLVSPFVTVEVLAFVLSLMSCPAEQIVAAGKIIAMSCFTLLAIAEFILIHVKSGLRLADMIAGTIVVEPEITPLKAEQV